MPLSLVVVMLSVATVLLWRQNNLNKPIKTARALLSLALLSLLLFSWHPVTTPLLRNIEQTYSGFDIKQPVDYVIVLGNKVESDPSVPLTSHLSSSATARLMEGLRILNANPNGKLIVTGYASGNSKSSAQVYKEVAIAMGIDESRIIALEEPKDTVEEANAVANALNNHKDLNIVLVTSASHMPRAIIFFQSYFPDIQPAPTFFIAKHTESTDWRFDSAGLLKAERAIYEYLGQAWQWLTH